MMLYSKAILLLFGFVYGALGLWCFIGPEGVAARVGLEFVDESGRAEFQVVYGGLEMAIGVYLIICGLTASLRLSGLLFLMISSGFLFGVRGIALMGDGVFTQTTYTLLATEVVMLSLAASAFFVIRGHTDIRGRPE